MPVRALIEIRGDMMNCSVQEKNCDDTELLTAFFGTHQVIDELKERINKHIIKASMRGKK